MKKRLKLIGAVISGWIWLGIVDIDIPLLRLAGKVLNKLHTNECKAAKAWYEIHTRLRKEGME